MCLDAANLIQQITGWAANAASWAQEVADWAIEHADLANIISLATTLNNLTNTFLTNTATQLAGLLGAESLLGKLQVDTAQAQIDAAHDTAMAQSAAEFTQDHVPPPPQNRQLCDTVRAYQGGVALEHFKNVVRTVVLDGINNMYRGPNMDGAGPQYAVDERAVKCGKTSIANAPKTGNPLDGYPVSCIDPDPAFIDADVKISTLDGTQVLELPPPTTSSLTVGGQTVSLMAPSVTGTPGPKQKAQKMWVAAMNYCYQLAGPRPSPPSMVGLDTTQGRVATAQFNHCLAAQSAFVAQCAERVGRMTRPDCKDPNMGVICKSINEACYHATKAGVALPPGIQNCSDGLSQYQAEYLALLTCKTSQRYQDGANSGLNHAVLGGQVVDCETAFTQWRLQNAQENANIVNAARGLMELPGSCFGGTEDKRNPASKL
jgi:hypothetical protein